MNKITQENRVVGTNPSGDVETISIFSFEGARGVETGPHVHIQASVHGAELQGSAVIYKLMELLSNHPFKGKITFIPCANPKALNYKHGTYTYGRFNPNTGDNWNRLYVDILNIHSSNGTFEFSELDSFVENHIESSWEEIKQEYKKLLFKTLESHQEKMETYGPKENGKINLLLQKLSSQADIVLDLHTGPKATRYLYCAEYEKEKAQDLNFPHHLVIPNEFAGAMDEASFMPWYKLYEAFQREGRQIPLNFEAYTLELGSEEVINLEEAALDSNRILHFLNKRGMQFDNLEPLAKTNQYACLLKDYKSYYAPHGGLVEYLLPPGAAFQKGDVLARFINFKWIDLNNSQDKHPLKGALKELRANADGIVINHYPSSSVAAGSLLYQVMENIEII